jgi:ubiquinone/menaquinone biosynthesis C-methylase UbiE
MTAARRHFLDQYAVIRHSEGRGSRDPAYYRALPYADLTRRHSAQWHIRARGFDHFLSTILYPLEHTLRRPLDLLDAGAGNGWMSRRLALRGHRAIPLDIFLDDADGLGAIRKYAHLAPVAAEFDRLPFPDRSFDAVIFNSSLHYSADYSRTLREASRCIRSGGRLVILDSPLYSRPEHGEQMRAERQAHFERTYGFRSEALSSIEYLDRPTLARLAAELHLEWTLSAPWYGWRWAMRPWIARLRRRRPPSKFFLISAIVP